MAAAKIPLVICSNFQPTSIFLPLHRSADTLLTRAQLNAPKRVINALWLKTLTAKCANQYAVAHALDVHAPTLRQIELLIEQPTTKKEGPCARLYWDICSAALHVEAFERSPGATDGLNSLLNYAYAILLTQALQCLLIVGLDPLYGIGHATRERSTPLAYDLMEPFRPRIDSWAFKWFETHSESSTPPTVTPEYKRFLHRCFSASIEKEAPLRDNLLKTIHSLKTAFLTQSTRAYEPWQWRTIKWDGYLSALISQSLK